MTSNKIEERIRLIENRNKRVELDKAWESSIERKVLISLLTYIIVSIFFVLNRVEKPYLNALVPTIGFILSTLTLSFIKNVWIKRRET